MANTVFWTGIVGVSFPLWITSTSTAGDDATLGYTLGATMAVVMILSPFLGAFSDQPRRRMPFLITTTLVCIAASLLLGLPGFLGTLILFSVALGTMELGVIFYNSLLPEVSNEGNRGRITGLGVGIGFTGSFMAVAIAILFASYFDEPERYEWTFRVVALLFLVFAIPIFLLLKERPRDFRTPPVLNMVVDSWTQMATNVRNFHRFPGLMPFLVTRLFYGLGINTATAFGVVYASDTLGLSDREVELVLLVGISFAIPSGVLFGPLVDRLGPRTVLSFDLMIWIGLLLFALAIPFFSWSTHLWWAIGCLTGVAMAGVWTADRPFMLQVTPPKYTGEFFGLHSMVGKIGRVVGPLMWAGITSTMGQQAAVLTLAISISVAFVLLRKMAAPALSTPAARTEEAG